MVKQQSESSTDSMNHPYNVITHAHMPSPAEQNLDCTCLLTMDNAAFKASNAATKILQAITINIH